MALKMPMWAVYVMIIAVILLLVYVLSLESVRTYFVAQGKALIGAINDMTAGRPPWLHD